MPKRKQRKKLNVVPHPRLGNAPQRSGYSGSENVVRDSYWAYSEATIFVESAIEADVTKQNFTTFPRGYYVDILKRCRVCERKFIFFAQEQQHWYEVLQFYIDADCVNCPECQAEKLLKRKRMQRFSVNMATAERSDEMMAELAEDAIFLWQNEMLKNEHTLGRIKNLCREQIADHPVVLQIEELVSSLRTKPADTEESNTNDKIRNNRRRRRAGHSG